MYDVRRMMNEGCMGNVHDALGVLVERSHLSYVPRPCLSLSLICFPPPGAGPRAGGRAAARRRGAAARVRQLRLAGAATRHGGPGGRRAVARHACGCALTAPLG
jgi:hypothetical protein